MQELTINRVEKKLPKKPDGNPFFVVYGQGGEEMTSFDAALEAMGKGARISVEIVIKGKHTNIVKWSLIEPGQKPAEPPAGAKEPASPGPPAGYKRDTDGIKFEYELRGVLQGRERVSIEGQTALAEVGNMIRALAGALPERGKALILPATQDIIITPDIIALYQKATTVALTAFIGAHSPAPAPVKDAEVAPAAKPAEKLTTAPPTGAPAPAAAPAVAPAAEKSLEFKDGTALVNHALKMGWRIHEIRNALKIENPSDIKDVAAAAKVLFPPEKPPQGDPNDPDHLFK